MNIGENERRLLIENEQLKDRFSELVFTNQTLREEVHSQGEFIQKIKRDIRDFLNHPSLG